MSTHIDNSLGNQDCVGLEGVDKRIRIKSMTAGLADAVFNGWVQDPEDFFRIQVRNEGACKKIIPILIEKATALEKYELAERFKNYYLEVEKTWV